MSFLFLLLFFFLLVIGVATVHASSASTAHIEVVHVVLVPVVAEGLGLVFLIFVDPLSPISLDVSVLYLLLGQARPVRGVDVGLGDVENDVATLGVPLGALHVHSVEECKVETVDVPMRFSSRKGYIRWLG
jgi:hypothetical protein